MSVASGKATLLERRLPAWHFRERHHRHVEAPPAEALRIALGLRRARAAQR